MGVSVSTCSDSLDSGWCCLGRAEAQVDKTGWDANAEQSIHHLEQQLEGDQFIICNSSRYMRTVVLSSWYGHANLWNCNHTGNCSLPLKVWESHGYLIQVETILKSEVSYTTPQKFARWLFCCTPPPNVHEKRFGAINSFFTARTFAVYGKKLIIQRD